MDHDFKDAKKTAQFSYRRNPHHDRSFMILENQGKDNGYEPIGDYTVLDLKEDEYLSEKKIMNLVSLLNGHDAAIDLKADVDGSRIYYYEAPHSEDDRSKILFYKQDGEGVSRENALFLINKEVWGHA